MHSRTSIAQWIMRLPSKEEIPGSSPCRCVFNFLSNSIIILKMVNSNFIMFEKKNLLYNSLNTKI